MFEIDGMITGFDLHPSGDYLVVSSDQGFYYIFRVDTGELRGKVPIMTDPAGLAIDPSGLYLAVAVKNSSAMPDGGIRKRWNLKGDRAVVEGSRTRIVFYELGTGM